MAYSKNSREQEQVVRETLDTVVSVLNGQKGDYASNLLWDILSALRGVSGD